MQKLIVILSVLGMLFIASCSSDKGINPNDKEPDDKDKYDFETVTIGNQLWMKKNLEVTHYRNGDPIFHAKTKEEWKEAGNNGIGAWCYYAHDPENGKIYGKLYNWYAVNDPRGLAPEGWRVPSDDDWKELEMALGMTQEQADVWNWRGGPVGAKLAGGYDLWINGNLCNHDYFNSSGLSGLPGGYCATNGDFDSIINNVYWWTTTEFSSSIVIHRGLYYCTTNVYRYYSYKRSGLSVRCLRDK